MNKKHLIMIIVVFFIGIAGIVFYKSKNSDSELIDCDTQTSYSEEIDNSKKDTDNSASNKDSTYSMVNKDKKIFVHICGEVNEPGVYELKEDARVIDAIKAAKGLTKAASQRSVNQAKKLEDSEQIYIPSVKEMTEDVKSSAKSSENNSSINNEGKIDINTASQEELTTLPGIGIAKAQKIIAYRQENGSFSKIEDIMKISGIKEGLFNKISENITV